MKPGDAKMGPQRFAHALQPAIDLKQCTIRKDDIMNWCLHTLWDVNVLLHVKTVVHPNQV